MVQAFNYKREDLHKMTVPQLKGLVQKHNFVNQIKRYSSMRKRELIEALMEHSGTTPKPKKKTYKKGKKDKLTGVLVPQLKDGLYGKDKLIDGARKQHETHYGKKAQASKPKGDPPNFISLPKRRIVAPARYRQ